MDGTGLHWLAITVAVLLPVWAIFLFARARLGVADYAWSLSARASIESRSAPRDDRNPRPRAPRDRPGNCSSCGSPIDDADFERCWNCAGEVR